MDEWYLSGAFGHPGHREYVAKLRRRAECLTDVGVERLIETLLLPPIGYPDDSFWLLALCGRRAVPALVRSLEDQRFLTPESTGYEGPFERLWQLIDPLAPPEAVGPLGRLLRHPRETVVRHAALALGSLGLPSCAEPLCRALRSEDHWVRSSALNGLERAMRRHRAEGELLSSLFPAVSEVLEQVSIGGTRAPIVLLKIDRDRAVHHLTHASRFNAGHREIASSVQALAEARVRLPPAELESLLNDLEQRCHKQRGAACVAFAYGLPLLALSSHPDAARRIEHWSVSDDDFVRDRAVEAWSILKGVPDAYAVAFDAWSGIGTTASLPEPLRHYVAVQVMRNEVANGSFEQYFFNSYAEDVKLALQALEALGASNSSGIVRKAIALFGRAGPSRDTEERRRQLEKLPGGAFDALSDAFLKDPDRLPLRLIQHAEKYREYFVRNDLPKA